MKDDKSLRLDAHRVKANEILFAQAKREIDRLRTGIPMEKVELLRPKPMKDEPPLTFLQILLTVLVVCAVAIVVAGLMFGNAVNLGMIQ